MKQLTGHTSRDDNDVGILESLFGLCGILALGSFCRNVASGFLYPRLACCGLDINRAPLLLRTYGLGGDVRQVGCDTGGIDDIVEGKLVD